MTGDGVKWQYLGLLDGIRGDKVPSRGRTRIWLISPSIMSIDTTRVKPSGLDPYKTSKVFISVLYYSQPSSNWKSFSMNENAAVTALLVK